MKNIFDKTLTILNKKISLSDKFSLVLIFFKILLKYFVNKDGINFVYKGFKYSFLSAKQAYVLFSEIFIFDEYGYKLKTNKNPIIIDCGANVGIASIYLNNKYKDSKIYSFEPDKDTFLLLKKNIKLNNLKNIKIYNYAVSDKNGVNKLYKNNEVGSLTMSLLKKRGGSNYIKIKTIDISKFIRKIKRDIDILKMDIEGSECLVLDQLDKSKLLSKINNLILEYHHNINRDNSFANFLTILEKNNFRYTISAKRQKDGKDFQDINIVGQRE